ncbi:MAG TPA: hypothetical protein VFE91_01790 [Nitrososphaerales archaeon]|nr:hypothetical protein [Nitrososphaerales archaeon]
MGIAMLLTGASLLISGFLTKYFFFEFDALVSLLLGLVLLFRETGTLKWRTPEVRSVVSLYSSLADALSNTLSEDTATYAVPSEAEGPRVFLHLRGSARIGPTNATSQKTLELTPPGRGIYLILAERLDKLRAGPESLEGVLPGVIVDDLGLAKDLEFKLSTEGATLKTQNRRLKWCTGSRSQESQTR